MANPNIVNVTDIRGKTSANVVTTSATAIVENTAGSNKLFKINTLIISNVDGTNAATIDVDIYRNSTAYRLLYTVNVPADSALTAIDRNAQIYLQEGDALRVTASADGDLEAICSYEEIS